MGGRLSLIGCQQCVAIAVLRGLHSRCRYEDGGKVRPILHRASLVEMAVVSGTVSQATLLLWVVKPYSLCFAAVGGHVFLQAHCMQQLAHQQKTLRRLKVFF